MTRSNAFIGGLPSPAALKAERDRRRYLADPVAWFTEVLGDVVWSKQRAIAEAVRDYRRVAVPSCHGVGKSFIAARILAWWLSNYPVGDAFVVTSAPTFKQVAVVLWREIGRAHAHGKLRGRVNQTSWLMTAPAGNEELVAYGRKPADMDPTAFQGIHARYVLVIFDEACGMTAPLWEAADSLIANEESHLLAIGNPDDPATRFAEICKPGSGYHVVRVSAFDSPNFTDEAVPDRLRHVLIGPTYVAEKKRLGESSPIYQAKVLGQFPEAADDGLLRISWVRDAQERELSATAEPNEIGGDIAGEGSDQNVIAHRRGGRVRIREAFHEPDTMKTAGKFVVARRETGATSLKIDKNGIGHGVFTRLRELGHPAVGINVGEAARDSERFVNLKAELYWGLRERFEAGDVDIDPDDDELATELLALRYSVNSRGQIVIESKEDLKKRIGRSPDRAEALMLAFADEGSGFLSWMREKASASGGVTAPEATEDPEALAAQHQQCRLSGAYRAVTVGGRLKCSGCGCDLGEAR